jgi:hypothetical protein
MQQSIFYCNQLNWLNCFSLASSWGMCCSMIIIIFQSVRKAQTWNRTWGITNFSGFEERKINICFYRQLKGMLSCQWQWHSLCWISLMDVTWYTFGYQFYQFINDHYVTHLIWRLACIATGRNYLAHGALGNMKTIFFYIRSVDFILKLLYNVTVRWSSFLVFQ